ncbi:MAG: DUF1848 domain-containing protein [Eubacterium sp.]|nr:DUF1848 domain-containing protein [Eubacterium sp.]
MIIQTGARTDIPAFYAPWFANRIKEGYVMVRNPYYPEQVTRYSLSPDVVDLIGFCTKNPAPMFPYMELLRPYGQYWFVTITPYGKEIEPNVPEKEVVLQDFRRLSRIVGVDSIAWRYDPILVNQVYTIERHIAEFKHMAGTLAGYTKTCVISFIDLYKKVQRNFPEAREVTESERLLLGKALAEIAQSNGMILKACAEGTELERFGVDCKGCLTMEVFEGALHRHLKAPKKKNQRGLACSCYLGADIGGYDTCGHMCRYCYANTRKKEVEENMRKHDSNSPFLIGHGRVDDVVHIPEQRSWIDEQVQFDFDKMDGFF